jgi:hypothetical protein
LFTVIPSFAQEEEPVDTTLINELKEKIDRQLIKEICNVPFGISIENGRRILKQKFGDPDYEEENRVVYFNISYAGFNFDTIMFKFQSDGYYSYFNNCLMVIGSKTKKDAAETMESLYNKMSQKYIISEGKDTNGNKYYFGGVGPVEEYATGFRIMLMKSPKGILNGNQPYQTVLGYGPYDFIKEEF